MLATIPLDSPTHFSKAFQPIDNSQTIRGRRIFLDPLLGILKRFKQRERERERESLGNLINSDSISIREIIRFFHLWEKERNSICWMDRYQHAPLRFASCKERKRVYLETRVNLRRLWNRSKAKRFSPLLRYFRGKLCLSLSLPPGGRKKEEGIERPRFVNFFSRRWNNKETRMKLESLTIYWIYGRKLVSSSALYPACTINSIN